MQLWYNPANANHRVRFPTSAKGRRTDVVERAGRRDPRGARASGCSTIRPTRRTTDRSSRWPATPAPSRRPTLALFEQAVAAIDLRTHQGEHPRLGAVDVVPFVPIEGVTMDECVALAQDVGRERGRAVRRAGLPLRGGVARTRRARTSKTSAAASSRGWRRRWPQAGWAPDFGPPAPHPSRRRVGHRRAHAAHRLQHQPRHRPPRRRQEDRRRHPPQQRRAAAT